MNTRNTKFFATPEEMAEYVGSCWRELQSRASPSLGFIVAGPLSSTPLPIYHWVLSNLEKFNNWKSFHFLLMDEQLEDGEKPEYVPLSDTASYERFAINNFLTNLSTKIERTVEEILIKPKLNEFSSLDDQLDMHGGVDILILAFGDDGHFAQVMPGVDLTIGFHVAELSALITELHTNPFSSSFPNAQFRKKGMSLGPSQVLTAKNVFVIASGKAKTNAVSQLLALSDFRKEFPISIVHHSLVRDRVQFCFTSDCLPDAL